MAVSAARSATAAMATRRPAIWKLFSSRSIS
jgi:hypothetical protein